MSRRAFLSRGLSAAGGGIVLLSAPGCGSLRVGGAGDEEPKRLVRDPGGLLDLPPGFQYRVVSEAGQRLADGSRVPGKFDGMAAFAADRGTVLVRNHELSGGEDEAVRQLHPYDRAEPGGTTAVLLDGDRRLVRQFVASSGTLNNCAGGATPWGTWITCEEDLTERHGYAFEVDPRDDPENRLSRTPIVAMGHFAHEAIAIDPATGFAYLTEDSRRAGGHAPSFLFRFHPRDRSRRPGALQRGGRLEALAIEERTTRNGPRFEPARSMEVVWRGVDPADAHDDAHRKGCVRFGRLEGCHFAGGAFWFADTNGGEAERGRLFRYLPATNTLELFLEGTADDPLMHKPDNVTVTPFGDLWFCTDGRNRVAGVTPEGELYEFARNRLNYSELAGPCFSPDGRTFFVNMQEPGLTFAVWGPFATMGPTAPTGVRGATYDPERQRRLAIQPGLAGAERSPLAEFLT